MPYGELYLPPILPKSLREESRKDNVRKVPGKYVAENKLEGERYIAETIQDLAAIMNVSHTTIINAIKRNETMTRGKLAGFHVYRL